ncbi:MAG: DUF2905 domain-containing protein [Methylocystaceae bacterium]
MNGLGRLFITLGIILVVVGVILLVMKPAGFPRLPGDIYYRREGFTFYFPLGWCILLSLLLTAVGWIFRR